MDEEQPRRDMTPAIGLAAAAVALIGAPIVAKMERDSRPMFSKGPEAYVAAAKAVDAFWADQFEFQFPDAPNAYRTPRLTFDDPRERPETAEDDAAGSYFGHLENIRVDLDSNYGFVVLVIAHEFGHHVQKLAGLEQGLTQDQAWSFSEKSAELSMRYELQAECLAGVWAHDGVRRGGVIDRSDVEAWRARYSLSADSETHGSARQRFRWFTAGYENGLASDCDTFAPDISNL